MFNSKALAAANARIEALEAEHRQYTDIVTNALVDAAVDPLADGYVAALEIASGQLSRAFTAAKVEGPGANLFTPWVMAQIGRQIVEVGDSVWYRQGSTLSRSDNYEFLPGGGYSLNFASGPVEATARRVLHIRWNINVGSNRGMGPLTTARTLRSLMQKLEASMSMEMNASVGHLLPIPTDGQDDGVKALRKQIAELKGKIALIETTRSNYQQGSGMAPRQDFQVQRLGPQIPDGNRLMFTEARDTILTACGYPISLLGVASDGTAQREAWRRYLHGTVAPLGLLVEEAARQLNIRIRISWESLFASDITGRARAFQSLVGGGMPIEQAAAASGLIVPE